MNQEERFFALDVQKINLSKFNQNGKVLDIGGGGEGIIGQLLGEKVVAIDPRSDELEEAAEGPLKIIMDAKDLKFLDKTFDGVTSFFTLMYIEKQYHKKVFQEIYRTLKNNGEFDIWDVTIPKYPGGIQDIFLIPLEIDLRDKKVTPTYGISWKQTEQNINYYIMLGKEVGFEVTAKDEMNETYHIKFKKKISY